MFRCLLRLLPPEKAHALSLLALRMGLGPKQAPQGSEGILFGKMIASLVGLPGGADKNAAALAGWRDMGFGFVEAGTVTLQPREGNAGERIWRQADGRSLVNWMGLPNEGLEAVMRNLAAFRRSEKGADFCAGVSLASPDGKVEELREMAAALRSYADFFTLNASCPNVSGHGAEQALEGIGAALRAVIEDAAGLPVLVKLGPTTNEASLRATVRYLCEQGAAGFIACNTIPATMAELIPAAQRPSPWPARDGARVGGYSGPALLPISQAMVRVIRSEAGKEKIIIGVGGIARAEDAQALLDAGADAVQLYTALTYQGPALLKHIGETVRKSS